MWYLHIVGAAHTGLTLLLAALQGSLQLQLLDGVHQSLLGPLRTLLTTPLHSKHMPLVTWATEVTWSDESSQCLQARGLLGPLRTPLSTSLHDKNLTMPICDQNSHAGHFLLLMSVCTLYDIWKGLLETLHR